MKPTDQSIKDNVRRGEDRGTTNTGWLRSRHSFSFGHYCDPSNTGYRVLRVINDDVISPGKGFPEHGHENMEIMTWVLEGVVKHGDNLGHMQELHHGELQVMSAGSGIRHSEFNASQVDPVRLLQIWILPKDDLIEPRYLQKHFESQDRHNRWDTVASGGDHPSALPMHQDAQLRIATLDPGSSIRVTVADGRYGYLHIALGNVTIAGVRLVDGDALTLSRPIDLEVTAAAPSELLFFDLP